MKSLSAAELGTVGLASTWLEAQTPALHVIRADELKARLEDALDRAETLKRQRFDALQEAADNYGRALAAALRARDELVAKFPARCSKCDDLGWRRDPSGEFPAQRCDCNK